MNNTPSPRPAEKSLERLSPCDADDLAAAFLLGYQATRGMHIAATCPTSASGWPLDSWPAHCDPCSHRRVRARPRAGRPLAGNHRRRLACLAGFYRYGVDEGLIDRSPVDRVRRPTVCDFSPTPSLDTGELRRFLATASRSSRRDHALAELLGVNGLRISEALGADVEDMGEERGHRTLSIIGKGGKHARIPLAARTHEALNVYLEGRAAGPLFQTATGRRLDRHAAAGTIRRIARRAGFDKPITPHGLRHSAITAALDAGVSLRDVQDYARHADPRTTRRYDRDRNSLDRHATYAIAARLAG